MWDFMKLFIKSSNLSQYWREIKHFLLFKSIISNLIHNTFYFLDPSTNQLNQDYVGHIFHIIFINFFYQIL